jgi:hypothetical protein
LSLDGAVLVESVLSDVCGKDLKTPGLGPVIFALAVAFGRGFVRINGEQHYLWRAVDQEDEVLESFVTKRRDRKAVLKFLRKTMKRYVRP